MMITLTPAHGRDYWTKAEVLNDFNRGKDFVLNCCMNPHDGEECNQQELLEGGYAKVRFSFKQGSETFIHRLR